MPPHLRIALLLVALVVASLWAFQRQTGGRGLPAMLDGKVAHGLGLIQPSFDGPDVERSRISVALTPVVSGLDEITDIQFPPGRSDGMVVLQKQGQAVWVERATGRAKPWFAVEVRHVSEMGLLGLAFHPEFATHGRFFVHLSPAPEPARGRVEEWRADPSDPSATPTRVRTVLEVAQPFANHDAGQIAFGPDGMLYVGFGDGGAANDRAGVGQDPGTWLGSMLRIDVSNATDAAPYRVPDDNPRSFGSGSRPEVWAIGLRNPWRFSFDPRGRLVAGDVGQNQFEEITFVTAGGNMGWPIYEGRACYRAGKAAKGAACPGGMVPPVYTYPRGDGISVTGGYVYTGRAIEALRGLYVFGDFGSGRLWAIELPDAIEGRAVEAHALGHWPIQPSTFGRDAAGELFVGDYGGTVYALTP